MVRHTDIVVWLKDIDREDSHLVGEKAANLGELIQNNFPVPSGFVITGHTYAQFLKENKLDKPIAHLLNSINYSDPNSLQQVSFHIKRLINTAPFSSEMTKLLFSYYEKIDSKNSNPRVAVRTSAIGSHSAMPASVVPHDSLLNIEGDSVLAHAIREVWSSLYDVQAIQYRHSHNKQISVKAGIIVQKMVESDFSGLVFTSHPITGDKKTIIIEAIYGLGDYLKNEGVKPDQYLVSKLDNSILLKKVQTQDTMLVKGADQNKEITVNKKYRSQQKISDSAIVTIAELAKRLEKHYFFPQDAEWSIQNGKLFITETQPLREIHKKESSNETLSPKSLSYSVSPLLQGESGSPGIGVGKVKIISKISDITSVHPGQIIVVTDVNKEYESAIRKANGVIIEQKGRSSYAARLAREFGIPAVVGATNAKHVLKNDMTVTVKGNSGEIIKGNIKLASAYTPTDLQTKKINTTLYISLNDIHNKRISTLPHDGIAVAAMDRLLTQYGIHPKKALHDKKQADLTIYMGKEVGILAKSIYPKPLVVSLSEINTNGYRRLVGGKDLEPQKEDNVLMGYRGSFRHIHDPRMLELELSVIKSVRAFGYNNVQICIPFTRTVKELEVIKKYIHNTGFRRSSTFNIWFTCSTPANAIQIQDYINIGIDYIIIDAYTLSQLALGYDRKNEEVSHEINELDESVLSLYKTIIETGKKNKIPVIFNTQSLSVSRDLLQKVIEWGISGISVEPENIHQTYEYIYELESK